MRLRYFSPFRNTNRRIAVPATLPPELDAPVTRLLDAILRLPGSKIVTVAGCDHQQAFDIAADGKIGHLHGHDMLLRAMLAWVLTEGGTVVIRQRLALMIERIVPNGKLLWIPNHRIYGVVLGNGEFHAISAEEMRSAQTTDHETGATLPSEDGVEYGVLPLEPVASPAAPAAVIPMRRGTKS